MYRPLPLEPLPAPAERVQLVSEEDMVVAEPPSRRERRPIPESEMVRRVRDWMETGEMNPHHINTVWKWISLFAWPDETQRTVSLELITNEVWNQLKTEGGLVENMFTEQGRATAFDRALHELMLEAGPLGADIGRTLLQSMGDKPPDHAHVLRACAENPDCAHMGEELVHLFSEREKAREAVFSASNDLTKVRTTLSELQHDYEMLTTQHDVATSLVRASETLGYATRSVKRVEDMQRLSQKHFQKIAGRQLDRPKASHERAGVHRTQGLAESGADTLLRKFTEAVASSVERTLKEAHAQPVRETQKTRLPWAHVPPPTTREEPLSGPGAVEIEARRRAQQQRVQVEEPMLDG